MRIRLNRRVTWSCWFAPAGFTALQEPAASAEYSPPGAFGGGVASTLLGGFGSVMKSHAAFSGGVAPVTGPWGQGAVTGTPTICAVTVESTSALVGSWLDARIADRAPSRAAWLRVS